MFCSRECAADDATSSECEDDEDILMMEALGWRNSDYENFGDDMFMDLVIEEPI